MSAVPVRSRGISTAPLRVVRGRRIARPQVGVWAVYTIVAIVAFFALIYSRTALDRSAIELERVEEQISIEENTYQQLRLEVARLGSPERIVPAAAELGLVYPDVVQPVAAAGVVTVEQDDLEQRWAEVKSVLSASP
jgi:cell division protein FtsL